MTDLTNRNRDRAGRFAEEERSEVDAVDLFGPYEAITSSDLEEGDRFALVHGGEEYEFGGRINDGGLELLIVADDSKGHQVDLRVDAYADVILRIPREPAPLKATIPASGTHLTTTSPFEHQTLSPSNRMSTEMIRNVKDGTTITDPPYQRGDVWADDQRRLLIASALRGLPIPAIIVNDRGTPNWAANNGGYPNFGQGLYAVVDGKQRVETFRQFFDSELAVPASWFNPEDIEASTTGADGTEWVTFDGLTLRSRRRCENRFNIPTITAQAATVEEEAQLYLTVNGAGVAQSDADLANAARVAAGGS